MRMYFLYMAMSNMELIVIGSGDTLSFYIDSIEMMRFVKQ